MVSLAITASLIDLLNQSPLTCRAFLPFHICDRRCVMTLRYFIAFTSVLSSAPKLRTLFPSIACPRVVTVAFAETTTIALRIYWPGLLPMCQSIFTMLPCASGAKPTFARATWTPEAFPLSCFLVSSLLLSFRRHFVLLARFELATIGLEIHRSIQLSYSNHL